MLYAAMRTLLVDEGPLENLFSSRLPPEQTAAAGRGLHSARRIGCRAVLGLRAGGRRPARRDARRRSFVV